MNNVVFLDLLIFKSESDQCGWYKIQWKPHFKPTALKSVLSFRSAHPRTIHLSWLTGYFERLRRNSWSLEVYGEAKTFALGLLRKAGISKSATTVIDRLTHYVSPVCPFENFQPSGLSKPKDGRVWIVFDFHPALKPVVLRAFAEFHRDPVSQFAWFSVFKSKFTLEASWKVSSPPLILQVRG